MEKLSRYKKTAGLVLLLIFAMYHCGLTLFPHSHTGESGTVTHSHPYLPGAGHSHSATQFQLISEDASTVFCSTAEINAPTPVMLFAAVIEQATHRDKPCVGLRHFSLRAPPVTE